MDKNMIHFTADTHFNHENIIKYCNRPFETLNEMNNTLISNWNKVVSNSDTVYHLGDFALCSFNKAKLIFKQLNGKIYVIPGSHDSWIRKNRIDEVISNRGTKVEITDRIVDLKVKCKDKEYYLVLCHYAMRVWPKSHHGSIHLYGHSHSTLEENDSFNAFIPNSLSFDVGVDCWNYYPINIEQVMDKINRKLAYSINCDVSYN